MSWEQGWIWSDGIWYLLGNVAAVNPFVDAGPTSEFGDALDVLTSTIMMVINTTLLSFAASLSYVGELPEQL